MKKARTVPSISKPLIDEETALEFASIDYPPAPKSRGEKRDNESSRHAALKDQSYNDIGKNMRQISLLIKKGLYNRIAKDAARKNRTIEEHLKKHLAKHYSK